MQFFGVCLCLWIHWHILAQVATWWPKYGRPSLTWSTGLQPPLSMGVSCWLQRPHPTPPTPPHPHQRGGLAGESPPGVVDFLKFGFLGTCIWIPCSLKERLCLLWICFPFRWAHAVLTWPSSTTCSSRFNGSPSTSCCWQVRLFRSLPVDQLTLFSWNSPSPKNTSF